MHIILTPGTADGLEAINFQGSLLAIGRQEEAFAGLERSRLAKLSKRHARIFEQDGLVYVADLHSTNGTYLNGERLDPAPAALASGDEVDFGGLTFSVEIVEAGAEEAGDAVRLVLVPERDQEVLEPVVVSKFPFLINKYSDAFSRYQETRPEELAYISRRHAYFYLRDGAIYIEDLGSTNGTFVHGEPLREEARKVQSGDTVAFGGDHFVYRVRIVTAGETGGDATVLPEIDGLEDSDRTIFIDSPTSFVDIYVGSQDLMEAQDGIAEQEPEREITGAGKTRLSQSLAFLGELRTAFLGDSSASRRTRVSAALLLVAVSAGTGYYLYVSGPQRAVSGHLDAGRYVEAAAIANAQLSRKPDDEVMRRLATQAQLKKITPEWSTLMKAGDYDTAAALVAAAATEGRDNPEDDAALAVLDWATEVAGFLDKRSREPDLNELLLEGRQVSKLVGWWQQDARTHARELVRLASAVKEFESSREQIYSNVRVLQALQREQEPVLKFRERLQAALDQRDPEGMANAIESFQETEPGFREDQRLNDDTERMAAVFEQLAASQWLNAYRQLNERPFATVPFREHADAMIGEVVPDAGIVSRYRAAADAWREGNTEAALGQLAELQDQPWGTEAGAIADRYRKLLSDFEVLMALQGQADFEARLFEYYSRLDQQADAFLVIRLQEDFRKSADAALQRAAGYLTEAREAWQSYRNTGGIGAAQRLEERVSAAFRERAGLLASSHLALERYNGVFAQLDVSPSAEALELIDEVEGQISFQRVALENLKVLDGSLRREKLALLPQLDG